MRAHEPGQSDDAQATEHIGRNDDRKPAQEVQDRDIGSGQHGSEDDDCVERAVEHSETDERKPRNQTDDGNDDTVRGALRQSRRQSDDCTGQERQGDHDGRRGLFDVSDGGFDQSRVMVRQRQNDQPGKRQTPEQIGDECNRPQPNNLAAKWPDLRSLR